MSNKQAYAGVAGLQNGAGEFNRLEFLARQVLNKSATATLVQVKAVTLVSGSHFVDVTPMVAQLDGAGNATVHGTVHNLPVWQVQAGLSAIVMVPVVGDIGLAVFCHGDISSVKKTKKPGNPGSRRKFDWADGIYLGGVLNPAPTQFIRISGSGIELISPTVIASENLTVGNGSSGVFTSADGKTVTVVSGIITGIV